MEEKKSMNGSYERQDKNCAINFKTLFNQSAFGFCIATPEGRFLDVNNCFAEMLGYSPSDMIGMDFREITYYEDLEKDNLLNIEMISGIRNYFEYEKRYVHKNGKPVWVKIFSSMVSDENDEILYSIVTIVNIAKQKDNERQLEEVNEELMEKNAVLEKEYGIIDVVLKRLEDAERLGNFGTFEFDLIRKVGWWSDNQYALHGYEVDEIAPSYEAHLQCVHPEERDQVIANFSSIMNGEIDSGRFDYRLIDRNGVLKYVHSEYFIEKDEDSKPVKIFGVDQDISYQHAAQKKIMESEEKFRLLTETSPGIILSHDIDGVITYVNERGCEFLGYSQNYLTGKSVDFLLPPDQAIERKKIIAYMVSTKNFELKETNLEIYDAHNERRTLKLFAKPLTKNDELTGIMLVAQDITNMIKYRIELENHRDHLEEMVQERTLLLEEQKNDLESLNKLFVGREFRIKELRDEVKALKKKLEKYNLD